MEHVDLLRKASREHKNGNHMGALRILNPLIGPDANARTYALLGKILEALDMKAEAAQAFTAAGNLPGSKADEYLKRAMQLHFALGNEDEALLLGEGLGHLAEKDADIAYILARILLKRGDVERISHLRKVLLNSKMFEHVRTAIGLMAARDGSIEDYELLLHAAKKFSEAEKKFDGGTLLGYLGVMLAQLSHEFSDYPVNRKYVSLVENEIAKDNALVLQGIMGFHVLHVVADDSLARLGRYDVRPCTEQTRMLRMAMPHRWSDTRLRIGYVSSDFYSDHATMKLLGNVLERHDRSRFDITLFCHTGHDILVRNNRFDREKWGRVETVNDLTDAEVAELVRENEIDILVDLKGHTFNNRVQIFNHPAAPVHVSWLGYPSTTTHIDLDYVIGDRFVLPDGVAPDWPEKFCRLPETYQPNDPVHRPRITPVSRSDFGLLADRFVFASFNHHRKISYRTIDLWCEILRRTPDSVIWLYTATEKVYRNLTREFVRQGVSEERVFFMGKENYAEHLNRIQLADLGLDTFPYNGHTTTSEQLWAGLPVLALRGTHFASRVSESLLNAMGLPELVAEDGDAYVDLAVALYHDRERLARYRRALDDGRFTQPLFDAGRFCRHLESAYEMMAARARAGLEPALIDVPALPPRQGSFEGEALFEEL